jgi:hypothetical protein
MTLGRLLSAWLPVAVWCALALWAKGRWIADAIAPKRALTKGATEGALLTLFGSLWFDSLGAGGWWLLFGLVGSLVALAGRPTPLLFLGDILRYVGAGVILAWRLGS